MIKDTLFYKYIQERAGQELIENEAGFIIYKPFKDYCFVTTLYVREDCRRQGHGKAMVLELLKKYGRVTGTVDLHTNTANQTLAAFLAGGAKVERADGDILYMAIEGEKNG